MEQPRKLTQEEINEWKKLKKFYDYYGIPHDVFAETEIPKEIERDWSKAIVLINEGKTIPKDLEQRLLYYKKYVKTNKKENEKKKRANE